FLAVFVKRDGAVVGGDEDVAAFTFDDDADLGSFVIVHFGGPGLLRQAAHFHDQGRAGVIVKDHQSIGGLGVIHVTQPAADRQDARGKSLFSQKPAGGIHLV